MKFVAPSFTIEDPGPRVDGMELLRRIEGAARTCYKSEDGQSEDPIKTQKFVQMILDRGHESVLEHEKITVRIVCDRGISHEIVRHRLASYSQESSRYCNYSKDKFGHEITAIDITSHMQAGQIDEWLEAMNAAERHYFNLLSLGCKPEIARSVLPNSLKTEIVVTANLREWRHILKLRTSKAAHPQMQEIMTPLLKEFKRRIPVVFDDIEGNNHV